MKAIERFYEERKGSVNWINVAMGQHPESVNPSDYNVKESTMRAQFRADGWKTKSYSSEEFLIYKGTIS